WFDNSADNIRNPHDPPQPVRWGEQTTDEMCIAFIQCATPRRIDGLTVFLSLARQLQLWRYARDRSQSFLPPGSGQAASPASPPSGIHKTP
ncbi:MAG TPA: hypothetical protein VEU62_04050, partial [Bryobacterales bacterium]|nr:hypothetical protein [Bryobacterales bacterium]